MRTILLCAVAAMALSGCAVKKTIGGKVYEPYGLINADSVKAPNVRYEPVWGNIIWSCILIETVIAPVYFFGFALFEPVGEKTA